MWLSYCHLTGGFQKHTNLWCDQSVWQVNVTLTNTGSVAGAEVVQMYVHHQEAPLTRALGAFTKIMLAPGESRVVSLAAHPLARRGVRNGMAFELSGAELRVGPLSCAPAAASNSVSESDE